MSEFNALQELLFGHSDALAEMAGEVSNTDRSLGKEIPLGDEPPDPFQKRVERMQLDPLRKSQGISDESWDATLTPATRFEKSCAAIRASRIFANDAAAAEEAILIAEQMLADERAAILAAA